MSGSNTDSERAELLKDIDDYLSFPWMDTGKPYARIASTLKRARAYIAGQSTASQPTLADDALAKVLAYCYAPEGIDIEGYAFAFLDPDKVRRIIRGQEGGRCEAERAEPWLTFAKSALTTTAPRPSRFKAQPSKP